MDTTRDSDKEEEIRQIITWMDADNKKLDYNFDYSIISQVPLPATWELPGTLFLGPRIVEVDPLEKLKELQISLLISVGFKQPIIPVDKFPGVQHFYNIPDNGSPETVGKMSDMVMETTPLIFEALRMGKNVYIHCKGGVSRSSTAVLHFLRSRGMSSMRAVQYLKKYRVCIYPNTGFIRFIVYLPDFAKS